MDREKILRKLGKKIRAYRELAGYSQEGFADVFGFGRSYYGLIERGQRNITVIQLLRIAKALKVHPCDLLD